MDCYVIFENPCKTVFLASCHSPWKVVETHQVFGYHHDATKYTCDQQEMTIIELLNGFSAWEGILVIYVGDSFVV